MVTWICLVMHLVLLHQSCHGWGSALVNALMVVFYKSPKLTGVKPETTDVKPAVSVVMHQRHRTLMCSVSNEPSSPNSATIVKGFWQSRRRRWQKRHLKSKLGLSQTSSLLFRSVQLVKCCQFSSIWRLWAISKFRKKSFCFDHVLHKTLNYEFSRRSRAAKVKKCKKKGRKKVRKECDSVVFGGRRERAWIPVVRLTSHWHGLFSSFSLLKTNTLRKTLFREWST